MSGSNAEDNHEFLTSTAKQWIASYQIGMEVGEVEIWLDSVVGRLQTVLPL